MVPPDPFGVPIDGLNRFYNPFNPTGVVVSRGARKIHKIGKLPRQSLSPYEPLKTSDWGYVRVPPDPFGVQIDRLNRFYCLSNPTGVVVSWGDHKIQKIGKLSRQFFKSF
jgi:hypothetical protein